MLRTRSWVADGSNPAFAMVSATASVAVIPRSWMLPRAVSSSVPDPSPAAACAKASSWWAAIIPPGSRTRTNAPSAAWCTVSAPGQASWSRVRATPLPYGGTCVRSPRNEVVRYSCLARDRPYVPDIGRPVVCTTSNTAGETQMTETYQRHPTATGGRHRCRFGSGNCSRSPNSRCCSATSAAVAVPPAGTSKLVVRCAHAFADAMRGALVRPRSRHPARHSYFEYSRMSREMDRL